MHLGSKNTFCRFTGSYIAIECPPMQTEICIFLSRWGVYPREADSSKQVISSLRQWLVCVSASKGRAQLRHPCQGFSSHRWHADASHCISLWYIKCPCWWQDDDHSHPATAHWLNWLDLGVFKDQTGNNAQQSVRLLPSLGKCRRWFNMRKQSWLIEFNKRANCQTKEIRDCCTTFVWRLS